MKKPLLDQYEADLRYDSDFTQLVYNYSHNRLKLERWRENEMIASIKAKSKYRLQKIKERMDELKEYRAFKKSVSTNCSNAS